MDEVKQWDVIELIVDSNKMIVNGKEVTIDVPAIIKNGRTMLPVRAIATAFDCECDWYDKERKVVIRKEKK